MTRPYRILLTVIPPKPSKAGSEVRTLLKEANLPTFAGGIRRYAAFQKGSPGRSSRLRCQRP